MKRSAPILALVALLATFLGYRACATPPVRNLSPRPGPVVVLGDSLAAGVGSTGGKRGYVTLLQERLGVDIVNKGVAGNTTADGLARMDADVLALKPSLVIVELGGNDFLRQVEAQTVFGNLETIIRRCQDGGAAVMLLGVRSGLLTDRNEKGFRDVARRTQTAYVPNILADVFGQPAFMHDSIHPNDAGYEKVATRIEPTVRDLLERLGKLRS